MQVPGLGAPGDGDHGVGGLINTKCLPNLSPLSFVVPFRTTLFKGPNGALIDFVQ